MTVERLIKILECIEDKSKEVAIETTFMDAIKENRLIGARNENDRIVLLSEDILG